MKLPLLLLLLLFASTTQAQTFRWAEQFGEQTVDAGKAVTYGRDGFVYSTGIFQGNVDFDPGPAVFNLYANTSSIYILKSDSAGNMVWAKCISASKACTANDIVTDADHNVYLVGDFGISCDFDPGAGVYNLNSAGLHDMFILKLDAQGQFTWVKQTGGAAFQTGRSIAVDAQKNVYTTGSFPASTDFDPGPAVYQMSPGGGGGDVFVSKLDSNGNFVWARQLGGVGMDEGRSVAVDAFNDILVCGYFNDTVDLDPGPGTQWAYASAEDMFLLKLDANGNLLWAKETDGAGSDRACAVSSNQQGSIYLSGEFNDTVDFIPGMSVYAMTAASQRDVFVEKLNAGGDLVWIKDIRPNVSYSIMRNSDNIADSAGNIYTCGGFQHVTDFDPSNASYTLVSGGNADIYFSALDSSGNFKWAYGMGSSMQDYGNGIATDHAGAVYVTGEFHNQVDFNAGAGVYNLSSSGDEDIFLLKYKPCGNPVSDTVSACDSLLQMGSTYTSDTDVVYFLNTLAGCDSNIRMHIDIRHSSSYTVADTACGVYDYLGQVFNVSGIYTLSTLNAENCDSIITLDLNIITLDTSVSQAGAVLSANAGGIAYQWLSCNPYQLINGATGQSYTVTANGSYAVIVIDGNCRDTSACHTIMGLGMQDPQWKASRLYPNPVHGTLYLHNADRSTKHIRILHPCGQVVMEKECHGEFVELDLKGLSPGIYFAELESGGRKEVIKVVKGG